MPSEQVYWVFTVTVDQMDKFTPLIPKLVAATEKEPGALQFESHIRDDQKTVGLPLMVAIIGGSFERFRPLVELYRETGDAPGTPPSNLRSVSMRWASLEKPPHRPKMPFFPAGRILRRRSAASVAGQCLRARSSK